MSNWNNVEIVGKGDRLASFTSEIPTSLTHSMEMKKLTIKEALKYARHDFLNELQLVLLNLDLDQKEAARTNILRITERMREEAVLDKLGLPAVETWIHTFVWLHPTFSKTVTTEIERGVRKSNDVDVASYLDKLFQEIERWIDPLSDYEVNISVYASQTSWSLRFTIQGDFRRKLELPEPMGDFEVTATDSENQWTFTIRGQ
ncbi:Spo0B domain-containing protein [Sporosarcina sp. HYO08]|uniref:Spo0B domain-containing protein n=1 Tax=Sporosarcina sp. HYO08 TaxID=1759557 RepID=UPI000795D852|nr:Spo0B domain-containing protein [Sporosarcina sp. HYO08]KXH87331.1 hypothetical protein AU377_01785 [Sporosarcina sp. HYO08]